MTVQLSKASLLARPDSTVLVDCITTPSDVEVQWDYQGKRVELKPSTGKAPEIYKLQNNTLMIPKIKRRNSGTYRCTGRLGDENRFEEFKVEVMCKCLSFISFVFSHNIFKHI